MVKEDSGKLQHLLIDLDEEKLTKEQKKELNKSLGGLSDVIRKKLKEIDELKT